MEVNDITRYFRVEPKEIGYLSYTIHAYEGLGVVRTLDPDKGIIEIIISPDFRMEFEDLIKELSKEVLFEEIDEENITNVNIQFLNGEDFERQ